MYKFRTRIISMLLSIILLFNLVTPALAVMQDTSNSPQMTLMDKDGKTVEVDKSWEEQFPYGTFAFETSQLATKEGAKAQTIRVYRLGGTKGKAELALQLSPTVSQLDDGAYSFATAAGTKDYTIEVEDMLPIAAYQAFGVDAPPLAPATPVSVSAQSTVENTVDENGETVYGSTVLCADVEADSYRWQGLSSSGAWTDLGYETKTIDVSNEAIAVSDFRCVYTINGISYCTDSFGGERYVAEKNESADIPDNIERNPAQSFHTLDLSEGEYDSYLFYMTFAEGEWVKDIRITPVDDELSESVELLTLTIDSCKGGVLHDTANTMMVSIEDNDEVLPSFFSLETAALTVDKATGSAYLTVKRTGALQYVATIDYHTVDGTALAGVDYAATSGTLYFASDIDEAVIEIPLINDGTPVDQEAADKAFSVVLENPAGGGVDSAITGGDTATVSLYNTGATEQTNLATMLYTPEADDVTAGVPTTQGAIASGAKEVLTAAPQPMQDAAPVEAIFGAAGDDEVSLLTYDASATLNLTRWVLPTSSYWNNSADLGGMSSWSATNNTQGLAYQGWDDPNQITIKEDGYAGRYVEDIGGDNGRFNNWNFQKISDFDQLFTKATGQYSTSTNYNWLGTFWSTAWGGIANRNFGSGDKGSWAEGDGTSNTSRSVNLVRIHGFEAGYANHHQYTFDVRSGDQGLFISLGLESKSGASTGTPNGSVYQKARALRRYLAKPLKYYVHTADDDTLSAAQKTDLYKNIAPIISVAAGKGGVTVDNKVYVGTQLSLSKPRWSSYTYAGGNSVYLGTEESKGNHYNNGSVAADGTASLRVIGGGGYSFANGSNLPADWQYAVNVVLNRQQNISVDISPSIPRGTDGKTIDSSKIGATNDLFWSRVGTSQGFTKGSIKVTGAQPDGINFTKTDFSATKSNSSLTNSTLTSAIYNNVRIVNFGLPEKDQILFNGVQYNGNANIEIPISMFGMETLPFIYYHEDYVSVESDMKLIITRVEHYIDLNGNGQLDGALDSSNQFVLEKVDGVEDTLVRTMDAAEYAITEFTPLVDEKGNKVQQFLKFYYNMTPCCLTVPAREGISADDRAQILPAFVTTVTDASQKAALSAEMQGYRFITSGKHSTGYDVYNANGDKVTTKVAGTYSGDNKLMYTAAANATETVDFPLGGDTNPIPATYLYQKDQTTTESKESPSVFLNKVENKGYSLSDITFKREDWNPGYQGNLLYEFHSPGAIFVSDSLVGENLPVAALDAKQGENGAKQDVYNVTDLNNYLGSFNPLDTVSLCIRPQSMTTDEIHEKFDVEAVSVLADVVQSGEYSIAVDSTNPAGFKTVPDASGLRRTSAGDADVTQGADSGSSSNSMTEFNVDLGIELPSLSVGLTDYVTLIMDGSQFGFSIGIPVFKAEKSKSAYTTSDKKYGTTKPAYGSWEKSGFVGENKANLTKVKDAFANPSKLINSEEWKSAKNAKDMALDSDKLIKSKSFEFSVAFNVTVMFKYSPTDNTYRFSSAMIFLQFGFQFKVTARLTVCPIVYAYFVVGASLELAGGVVNEREVVEKESAMLDINEDGKFVTNDNPTYTAGTALALTSNLSSGNASVWESEDDEAARGKKVLAGQKGDAFTFISKSDAVNLYFSGKVKVEIKDGSAWKNLGYVASTGTGAVLVMFDEKVEGEANVEVRITALDDKVSLDRIVPIEKVRNDTYFSGLSLTPAIFLEVGAGIGVEVLKVEIFFKANIGCNMSFFARPNNAATGGSQLRDPSSSSVSVMGASANITSADDEVSALDDKEVEKFSFNPMTFKAGFGVRVVLLLFNFELDAIQFGIDYNKEMDKDKGGTPSDGFRDSGWKFAWYVLNGSQAIATYDMSGIDDSEGFPGIKITLPSNTYAAQQLFGPENAQMVMDEISALAFDPENLEGNEFQISGYGSSGDAFRLAKGLVTGTDYRLLTVGADNYLLYTISRKNPANAVDSNMLVLSKIQNTGKDVGLANPVTGSTKDGENYIPVDNDDTGDLDFSGNVTGNILHVSWVSYKDVTPAAGGGASVTMPTSARPFYEGALVKHYMDKDNYEDARFQPAEPSAPTPVVTKPDQTLGVEPPRPTADEITAVPAEADYFVTAADYANLPDTDKAKYTATAETVDSAAYHVATGYTDYATAKKAYDDDVTLYGAWQTYHDDKDAWDDLNGKWNAYNTYISSEEYKAYQTKLAAYNTLLTAYNEWFAYFNGDKTAADSAQDQLADSASSTVVKTASFTAGTDSAFAAPTVIADVTVADAATAGYKFLPSVSADGKLTFYARTNNYTAAEKTAATKAAQDYYLASRGDVTTDDKGLSTGEGDPTAAFRYAYTTSMDDVYGKNTAFMFSYTKDGGSVATTGFTPTGWDTSGTRLSSASMVMLSASTFYLAYTATTTNSEANVGTGTYGDKSVHKLYLQKGSIDPATGAVTLETAKMLRQLVDVNDYGNNTSSSLVTGLNSIVSGEDVKQPYDGVYANRDGSGAAMIEHVEDPYFGVVRFLRGDLGSLTGEEENFGESLQFTTLDASTSLFLLFEMNGVSYVVPESSLQSITAADDATAGEGKTAGRGAVIPFFTLSEDNRTRGNMSIGTDGDGNIAAVYTDTVANTTNNALFVSKYDPETSTFGEGRMLAMNHMQVYEDSIAGGWSPEDTEQAYYGKLANYKKGNMSSFVFSNLSVALGLKKDVTGASVSALGLSTEPESGAKEPPVAVFGGEEPASPIAKSTLVVLAQGTQTELEETNFLGDGSTKLVTAKYDENGSIKSSTGFYALSFGVGEKSVGEATLLFDEPTFVPGAQLRPTVTFKNTGDVPLRGSEAQPITVELWISGVPVTDAGGTTTYAAGEQLLSWTLPYNIAVGQSVSTSLDGNTYTSALPTELTGRKFYFTVQEYVGYVDDPINYSSLKDGATRLIEAKPELAVEALTFKTLGIDESGKNVRISVSMNVTNRGTADAVAPYLQFAYQTGRTMEEVKEGDIDYQQAIYGALDLSASEFEIDKQAQIVEALGTDQDDKAGILRLVGDDGSNLKKNYQRQVTGTLLIPKEAYCEATATGSLNLKVTAFDDSAVISSLSSTGLLTSSFDNEYSSSNNVSFTELEPMSFFTAPTKITIPLSTTLRMSLRVTTTSTEKPVITVSELNSQQLETDQKHLGILYYDMGTSGTGTDGYLVVTPSSQGSGFIRVADTVTSSYVDIAFTVDESGTGVNIFSDNDRFVWHDASGNMIAPNATSIGDFWTFQAAVLNWGHGAASLPYRGDLTKANKKNVSFTFTTLAEKIDLYFDGTVRVDSNFPGYTSQTLTAAGGENGLATINLGGNPDNEAHTVTITAQSDTVLFDKLVETFSKNQDILPDTGGTAPLIYFGRTLPETASLKATDYPNGLRLTVYVLDETGLAQPTFAGSTGITAESYLPADFTAGDAFRQFDVVVRQNGTFTVNAADTAGNPSSRAITVDWFNPVTDVATTDKPVSLTVDTVYRDGAGNSITVADGALLNATQSAFAQVTTDADATVTVQSYNVTVTTVTTTHKLVQEEGAWKLITTVTRTDEGGKQIGDPAVTKVDATATTSVPQGSVATETTAEWKTVTEDQTKGLYRLSTNAVYKVVSHSAARSTSSTQLFIMDRINSELPSITLTEALNGQDGEAGISYTAKKGKTSVAGIKSITVNGYSLFDHTAGNNASPSVVSDLFGIAYGGVYDFTVTDYAGNVTKNSILPTLPIAADEGLLTVTDSFAQSHDNGSVTVDLSKLRGGMYDASPVSTPASNSYVNVYQFALTAEAAPVMPDTTDMTAEAAEQAATDYAKAFDAFADGLAWTDETAFTGLVPGDYTLYVRDKEDTPDASKPTDYLISALTVDDLAVTFTAEAQRRSEFGLRVITVNATGGNGEYEFFLMPRKNSTDLLDAQGIEAAIAEDNTLAWVSEGDAIYRFFNCNYGFNQVAVRDKANPDNFYTAMVQMRRASSPPPEIIPVEQTPLTEKEQQKLIEKNQTQDVVVTTDDCIVIIPAGTLKKGDSVLDLLVTIDDSLTQPKAACVVRRTDADGNTRTLPWCMLSDGRMLYIADKAGKYELIQNAKTFTDVGDHWAADYITFTTARELFEGTAKELFSPDAVMTRGMFVTVLGRMHGIDPADYTAQSFDDVKAGSWFAPYVEWASKNGIVSGYGEDLFGPDDPITREQMAVILYGYAGFAGIETSQRGELTVFPDHESISGWASTPMSWAVGCELLGGRPDGSLDPKGQATRAEVSTILQRFITHTLLTHPVLEDIVD